MNCPVENLYSTKSPSALRRNVLDLLSFFYNPATVAHLEIDIDTSWARSEIAACARAGQHITMTAILLKAISIAQVVHPISRTFPMPFGKSVTFNDITGGFTVEKFVDGEPVVFFGEIDAPHKKSLIEISEELKAYHEQSVLSLPTLAQQYHFARLPALLKYLILFLGVLIPSFRLRLMKSTFGLSSLGSLGIKSVLGPSVCTSVFGIGAIEDRVCVVNHEIMIKPIMTISLNFDHRLMDAELAARFLKDVKTILEHGWDKETNKVSLPQEIPSLTRTMG